MSIRYPIRKWLGQYEKRILVLYGRETLERHDALLESFFKHFPEAAGLEQFTVSDIVAYSEWRKSEGVTENRLRVELATLNRFWNYLCIDRKLPLWNPVKPFIEKRIVKETKNRRRIGLYQFRRLVAACEDRRLKDYIFGLVIREERRHYLAPHVLGLMLRKLGTKVGLDWITVPKLRREIQNGLWCKIIASRYEQLRDSFFKEAQLNCDSSTDINISNSPIGSTILYDDSGFPSVLKIFEEELSAAG